MVKSAALALLVLSLSWFCAWAVRHFGRRAGEPEGKLRALTWMFVVLGLVGGAYAFTVDFDLRRETLFEVVRESAMGPHGTRAHTLEFDVEHQGVAHVLRVVPKPGAGASVGEPCPVAVRLTGPAGEIVVEGRGEARTASSTNRWYARTIWDGATWRFVPSRVGRHALAVELAHPRVQAVLVRVEDPKKRDGVRAPGY